MAVDCHHIACVVCVVTEKILTKKILTKKNSYNFLISLAFLSKKKNAKKVT